MANEIIVYLDDYKYGGDGFYDTMYLDYRTEKDYEAYMQVMGLKEPTQGSYIQVDGYRSPKRLFRGAYYALNMEMLKQLEAHPVTESLLFAHTYDFGNYEGRNDAAFHLLQSHGPLNAEELSTSYHNQIEYLEDIQWIDNLSFKVNDVSQANWNEVMKGDTSLFVYDIGAPIHATATKVQDYINQYAGRYAVDKPILIL